MCDTLFIPADARPSGSCYFAKNSDRNPDEPQVMMISGTGKHSCLLSRPVWMHGAEMGVNARGVVIGNEAVFAKKKADPHGVLGMDTLRSALEQADTARQAMEIIATSVENGTQGGNGAFKGTLVYDNSYLVADFDGAWIIETAGHRWAAKQLWGPGAISNTYSLTDEFERADSATLSEKGPGYSWKKRVESRLYRLITRGDTRRASSLQNAAGMVDGVANVFSAMRSHGPYNLGRPNLKNMTSVCMHEGGIVNNSTTASMVVDLRPKTHSAVIWFTAGPAPCLSLYRPALLEHGVFKILWTDYDYGESSQVSADYWKSRRTATASLQRRAFRDPSFAGRRDAAQSALVDLIAHRCNADGDGSLRTEVNRIIEEFERQCDSDAGTRPMSARS